MEDLQKFDSEQFVHGLFAGLIAEEEEAEGEPNKA
jgi:fused signal recognition particle receptor